MQNKWQKIINDLKNNPRDLHTVPKTNKKHLWFYAYTDGEKIYPIHLRREKGESVSQEATATTRNQVYWYSIITFFISATISVFKSTSLSISLLISACRSMILEITSVILEVSILGLLGMSDRVEEAFIASSFNEATCSSLLFINYRSSFLYHLNGSLKEAVKLKRYFNSLCYLEWY